MAHDDRDRYTDRLKGFIQDRRAEFSNAAVEVPVGLTVAGITSAYLLPLAIEQLVQVDTSSWSSGASSLWGIMDMIVVLGLFLALIGMALNASNG